MTTYVKVLSVNSIESSASIAVVSENSRILFNVGEGVQRLCVEHKIRLIKLTGIFLTESCTSNMGGLPG